MYEALHFLLPQLESHTPYCMYWHTAQLLSLFLPMTIPPTKSLHITAVISLHCIWSRNICCLEPQFFYCPPAVSPLSHFPTLTLKGNPWLVLAGLRLVLAGLYWQYTGLWVQTRDSSGSTLRWAVLSLLNISEVKLLPFSNKLMHQHVLQAHWMTDKLMHLFICHPMGLQHSGLCSFWGDLHWTCLYDIISWSLRT